MILPIIALILFFTDIMIQTIMYDHLTYMTMFAYCIGLLNGASVAVIMFMALLVSCASFLFWSTAGLELLYLIPISALAIFIRPRVHRSLVLPILLGIGMLGLLVIGIEWGIFSVRLSSAYTIRKIFINIAILCMMSLTLYRRGNQGDRL